MKKHKIIAGASALAAVIPISLGSISETALAYANCSSNYICVHEYANGGGAQAGASAAAYELAGMNNKATSLTNNRSANRARYYTSQDYLGNNVCVSAADDVSYPNGNFNNYNNDIESMAIQTSQYC